MRATLLVIAAALLAAGCATPPGEPTPASQPTDLETTDSLQNVVLSRQTGPFTVNSVIPFDVVVPAGGAQRIHWTLNVTGITVGFNVNFGPYYVGAENCPVPTKVVSGPEVAPGGTVHASGPCEDLEAGTHDFAVILSGAGAPGARYEAIVTGAVSA